MEIIVTALGYTAQELQDTIHDNLCVVLDGDVPVFTIHKR
jgi:hypothetical protein